MIKIYLFLLALVQLFLLINLSPLSAQHKNFDEAYQEAYNSFSSGKGRAFVKVDTLFEIAKDIDDKIRSLLLLAEIEKSMGDLSDALHLVLRAHTLAKKEKHLNWQVVTSGMLASYFRHIGLVKEARQHLYNAQVGNEEQKASPNYWIVKANIAQEKALLAQEEKGYAVAIRYLEEAHHCFGQIRDSITLSHALLARISNDRLIAVCNLALGQFEKADSSINLALRHSVGAGNELLSQIYRVKAELALAKGELDSSFYYLRLIERKITNSNNNLLRSEFFETYTKYYEARGDLNSAIAYREKHRIITLEQGRKAKLVLDDLYNKLNKDKQMYASQLIVKNVAMIFFISLFVFFVIIVWLKRKKEKAKFKALQYALRRQQLIVDQFSEKGNELIPEQDQKKGNLQISTYTEDRILSDLSKLEKTTFLLNKELTLAVLANKLDTNERYVSWVVHKYRNRDFKSYLQHYRIHYIMKRIEEEPDLLNYKLSYLAEISGFSSHSKFSAVFRSITGVSPSDFVQFVREKQIEVSVD